LTLIKKTAFILAFLHVCAIAPAFSAETLTLEECIFTALTEHPDLKAAESRVDSARAGIGAAAADKNTQLSASGSYTRSDSRFADHDTGAYNTGVQVTQSLFDWGRANLRIGGARLSTNAAEADYLQTRDNVIANVRSAYYALNRSIRQHAVAETRHRNYEQRLDWARSYYQVGTKAKIEVTKAEADLSNSKLALVRTESSAQQSKAELASAMGVPLSRIEHITDVLDYEDWDIPIEQAVQRALANRPELLAKQKRVEYAKTQLELQMKGLSPSISVSGGYTAFGSAPFDDNSWNARISVNVPIFDGGLTKSRVEGARADLAAANAEFDSLTNSVMLDVRRAWESLVEAKQALSASIESERYAKETLDLALGRYKAGVGDSLEISDAVDSYASAQANTVLSLYECKQAQLDLEKAMGGLDDEQ